MSRRNTNILWLLLCAGSGIAMASTPALAQPSTPAMEHEAPVDCSLVRFAPPPGLEDWGNRAGASAAKDKKGLGKASLEIGRGVDARLVRTADIQYEIRPEKPGGSMSYGGMFSFVVSEAGTYRVALGAGAWIDLVRKGKAVESTNHGHGPACSGIRKIVDFPLVPGRYVLQLAANGSETLPVMVAKLP